MARPLPGHGPQQTPCHLARLLRRRLGGAVATLPPVPHPPAPPWRARAPRLRLHRRQLEDPPAAPVDQPTGPPRRPQAREHLTPGRRYRGPHLEYPRFISRAASRHQRRRTSPEKSPRAARLPGIPPRSEASLDPAAPASRGPARLRRRPRNRRRYLRRGRSRAAATRHHRRGARDSRGKTPVPFAVGGDSIRPPPTGRRRERASRRNPRRLERVPAVSTSAARDAP